MSAADPRAAAFASRGRHRRPSSRGAGVVSAAALAAATFLTGAAGAQPEAAPPRDPPSATQPAAEPTPEALEVAKRHFERGVELLAERRFDMALTEFLRSLEKAQRRSATENAAVCLRELGRLDEALELFERALSFSDITEEVRQRIDPQIADLSARLGALTVTGAEDGALVSVDGRPRGTVPLPAPLRVLPGQRTVRVHLDGFVPIEKAVRVVAGKPAAVSVKMDVLARAGRLRVSEKNARDAYVVVDGVVVGHAPWEGSLAPGPHAVWLTTEKDDATAPREARVLIGQRAKIELELQPLRSQVVLRTSAPGASLSIDGVVVGSSSWEGRLAPGKTTFAASAAGFAPQTRSVELRAEQRETISFDLVPLDVAAATEPEASARIEVGARGAVAIAPYMFAPDCSGGCSAGLGLGGHVEAQVGYRFPVGFAIGAAAGYLRLSRSVEGRPYELRPPGKPPQQAEVSDAIGVSAATVLAEVSYRGGRTFFGGVGVGAGGFGGTAWDERSVSAIDSTQREVGSGPYHSSGGAAGLALSASARAGLRVADVIDLWAGVGALFLGLLERPAWDYAAPIPAGADGAARFQREGVFTDVIIAVTPAVGVTAAFE